MQALQWLQKNVGPGQKYGLESNQNLAEGSRDKTRVLGEMSMNSVAPILVGFQFLDIHPSVDIYAIFRF